MWEDKATTDPTNRCSEAIRGHKHEGVTNENRDRRCENEEAS
jgi:hypothetical protein